MPRIQGSRLFVTAIIALAMHGCGGDEERPPSYPGEMRFENIVRIFCHERDYYGISKYTIWCQPEGSTEIVMRSFTGPDHHFRFFVDVPAGETSWARHYHIKNRNDRDALDFHLRSPNDVLGSGWDHGEQGKGTTQALDPNAVVYEFGLGNR